MLANISEMITDIRSLINETTASFWNDTEITRWVNQGQEILSSETGLLSSFYTRTLEASDIVNDREIRLPSDFIAFDEGGVTCNDDTLKPTSISVLDTWGGNWRDNTGTPKMYYIRGDYIGLYPAPSAGDVISFYGIERPEELSDTETPFNGDYRTVAFRIYIRDFAIAQCWYKKNEMDKYYEKLGSFYAGVRKVNSILNSHKDESLQMIPEYRPTRVPYVIRWGRTDVFD
jgi:hypothetical protein